MRYLKKFQLLESISNNYYNSLVIRLKMIRDTSGRIDKETISRINHFYGKGTYEKLSSRCDKLVRYLSNIDTSYMDSKFIEISDAYSSKYRTSLYIGLSYDDNEAFMTYKPIDIQSPNQDSFIQKNVDNDIFYRRLLTHLMINNTSYDKDHAKVKYFDIDHVLEDWRPCIYMSVESGVINHDTFSLRKIDKLFRKIVPQIDSHIKEETELIYDRDFFNDDIDDMEIINYKAKIVIEI